MTAHLTSLRSESCKYSIRRWSVAWQRDSTHRSLYLPPPAHRSVNTVCTLRIPVSLTRILPTTTTPNMNPTNPPLSVAPTPVGSPTLSHAQTVGLGQGRSNRSPEAMSGLQPSLGAQGLQMTSMTNGSVTPAAIPVQEYRTIKCCFSFTIRRDSSVPLVVEMRKKGLTRWLYADGAYR